MDLGPVRPTEGLQLHHEGLEEALQTGTQFSRERWQMMRVKGVSAQIFVTVGGRFYRPAPTGETMDWVQRKFIGCTPGTCGKAVVRSRGLTGGLCTHDGFVCYGSE